MVFNQNVKLPSLLNMGNFTNLYTKKLPHKLQYNTVWAQAALQCCAPLSQFYSQSSIGVGFSSCNSTLVLAQIGQAKKDNWAITILWAGQRGASVFSRFREVDTTIEIIFINDHWQVLLKYGSEKKGSSFCRFSILLGFIMSKNLRGLWFYLVIKVQNATSLVFLT